MFGGLRVWVWLFALIFGAVATRPAVGIANVFAQEEEREEDAESSQTTTSEAEIKLEVFRTAREFRLFGPARVAFYTHCSQSPRAFPAGVLIHAPPVSARCRLQI